MNGFSAAAAQAAVGDERQHDQRGGGEQQAVMDLVLGERVAREAVQAVAEGEQEPDRDRDAGGEPCVALRERAEQERHHQRDLGRHAGVGLIRADGRDDRRRGHEAARDGHHGDASRHVGEPAQERHQGERADPRRSA